MKIATVMQQDGREMKRIADISRKIAMNAARDSGAMKIIADVTIYFLPATFAAVCLPRFSVVILLRPNRVQTVFSSPFFNFQAQERERVVSWWIWLYIVVAVILTALIRFVWYVSCKRRDSTVFKSYDDTSRDAEAGTSTWMSGISPFFQKDIWESCSNMGQRSRRSTHA